MAPGARHPIGRLVTSEDVAYGVLYLATDESSFVTGSELVIDGEVGRAWLEPVCIESVPLNLQRRKSSLARSGL